MLFDNPKKRVEKYIAENPHMYTIVVCGSYGRRSAIRALGYILSRKFDVALGVNRNTACEILILDYSAMQNFPDINPSLVVITSCNTDEQAKKYFNLANRAEYAIINYNDVSQEYAKYLKNPETVTYGDELPADYYFENHDATLDGCKGDIVNPQGKHYPVEVKVIGEHNLRPIVMAAAVARLFDMPREDVLAGVQSITSLHGRMSPAKGMLGSVIIDDSAETSANSVRLGVKTICGLDAPSRIVVSDNVEKFNGIDLSLIAEVLILSVKPQGEYDSKFKFFDDELELLNYLGGRLEEGGIVLLEIPLSDIIEQYKW